MYVEHWTLAVDIAGRRAEHLIGVEFNAGTWEATTSLDDRISGLATTREADDGAALAVAELVGRLLRRSWAKGWRVLSIVRIIAPMVTP